MSQDLNNPKNNVRNVFFVFFKVKFRKNLEAFAQIIKAITTNVFEIILWNLDGMFSIVLLTLLKKWNTKLIIWYEI